MIKFIFFDLGGVLFTNGTARLIEYLKNTYQLDQEKLRETFERGELVDSYRTGQINRQEFWSGAQAALSLPESIEELESRWIAGYELIQGTKEIISELRQNYKIYFLSDNVKDRVEVVDKKFNFLALFEGGIFSHQVGVRKPHPLIYQLALEKAGAVPGEALFIDDKALALEPAAKLGMTTVLFESPQQLKNELSELGLLK
jgi:HAD superfamily hydrolase (TIGR01509 family)